MRKETYDRLYYGGDSSAHVPPALPTETYERQLYREYAEASSKTRWLRIDDPGVDLQNHLTFSIGHIFLTLGIGALLFPLVGPLALIYMVFIGSWLHSLIWVRHKRKQRARIIELRTSYPLSTNEIREFIRLVDSNV